MGIEKVRRWQWVALSLVAGFIVAEVRRAIPQPLTGYGSELSDQKTFESAIVQEFRGRRLFHDLVVYPVEVDEGGTKSLKHFVTGQYFNGRPRKEGGSWRGDWKPYCFVAPIPFKPMTGGEAEDPAQRVLKSFAPRERNPDAGVPATAPATTQALASNEAQTVVDYLDRMSREKGVRYSYAWWLHPRWQLSIWMAGSFVLIGVVWPTFVNVMAFGTLRRPPEEATGPGWRETLRAIFSRRRQVAASPKPAAADVEAEVREYDEALQAQLAARGDGENDPVTSIGPDLPPPHAQPVLSAAPEPVVAGESPHEEHHYEAKRDDFYPTEKKPVHHR